MKKIKSICVFCGSRFGSESTFEEETTELGYLLAANNIRLVFGGGCVGLMGTIANAVLEKGGTVLGIIPELLIEKEIPHDKVTKLLIVKTLHERKHLMAENADAFIVLPGGIGTMEEFFEVFTWNYLDIYSKPIGILNTANYFDAMIDFLNSMNKKGFVESKTINQLVIKEDGKELINGLENSYKESVN